MTGAVADPGFPRLERQLSRGVPQPIVSQKFLMKTARKWKNLDQGSTCPLHPTNDPTLAWMIAIENILIIFKLWRIENFQRDRDLIFRLLFQKKLLNLDKFGTWIAICQT